jgi:ADP-ribose pyrophosphatase YjhB (NUDIX family)
MKRRVTVRAIIVRNGKLLCVRQKPYKNSIQLDGPEWWCLPGGGLEPGEPVYDGLWREMMEETGIAPDIGNLLYIQQFDHKDSEFMDLFLHVKNAEDYRHIDLTKTTHGVKEIAEIGFVDPKKINIRPTFLAVEDLSHAILNNEPTKIFNNFV